MPLINLRRGIQLEISPKGMPIAHGCGDDLESAKTAAHAFIAEIEAWLDACDELDEKKRQFRSFTPDEKRVIRSFQRFLRCDPAAAERFFVEIEDRINAERDSGGHSSHAPAP